LVCPQEAGFFVPTDMGSEDFWGLTDRQIDSLELNFDQEGYKSPNPHNAINRFGVGETPSLEEWLNRRQWRE